MPFLYGSCARETFIKIQIDGAPVITYEKKTRPVINLYQKTVMKIPFVYGLTFVSVMDYTYPKRI